MNNSIRKQVGELRAEDFEAYPCWGYASDEEGSNGQDESTVRPLDPSQLESETGQFMVQAVFFFPNGQVRLGMITLNAGDDPSGHQPIMFLGKKSLHFYNGSSEPSGELRGLYWLVNWRTNELRAAT